MDEEQLTAIVDMVTATVMEQVTGMKKLGPAATRELGKISVLLDKAIMALNREKTGDQAEKVRKAQNHLVAASKEIGKGATLLNEVVKAGR